MSNLHILEQVIVTSLEPMYEQAEEHGLWFFHCNEQGEEIWCSPGFLQREQEQGRLIIAPEQASATEMLRSEWISLLEMCSILNFDDGQRI